MSKQTAEELCEDLAGEACEQATVEGPDWITVTGEQVSPGRLAAIIYIDPDGSLWEHEFSVNDLPVLMVGDHGLVAVGNFTLTDLGIEDD
jgi:hypothetical protein